MTPTNAIQQKTTRTNIESAINDYYDKGYKVFPINITFVTNAKTGEVKKHADFKNTIAWRKNKSQINRENVLKMAETGKYNSLAMLTGKDSNCFVVDFDLQKNEIKELLDSYDVKLDKNTPLSRTQSGGYHAFFSFPQSAKYKTTTAKKEKGIDLRGDGGLVFVPPSRIDEQHVYSFVNELNGSLKSMPDSLNKMLEDIFCNDGLKLNTNVAENNILKELSQKQKVITEKLIKASDTASPGSRSEKDFALICWCIKCNLKRNDIFKLVSPIGKFAEKATQGVLNDYFERTFDRAMQSVNKEKESQLQTSAVPDEKKTIKPKKGKLFKKYTKNEADKIKDFGGLNLPAPDIKQTVLDIINKRFADFKTLNISERVEKAGDFVITYLQENGFFIRSNTNELYYFHSTDNKLYDLETSGWGAFLYTLTGLNPSGNQYTAMNSKCKTIAMFAQVKDVFQVSNFDAKNKVLRVSNFDGTVFVLDGNEIKKESNGENVIFYDQDNHIPFNPVNTDGNMLSWIADELPNWETEESDLKKQYSLCFKTWMLSCFFTDICTEKPLILFRGEMGSGKSLLLRAFLKLMFGDNTDIKGSYEKAEDFKVAAVNSHILTIDNLDKYTNWLQDMLAGISTGKEDTVRKLYTNKEVINFRYKCWIAITSRTPLTLKRDDLTDRLITLPLSRIADESRFKQLHFFDKIKKQRNEWWGTVLNELNKIVGSIRRDGIDSKSKLRIGDWETLGRVIAKSLNPDNSKIWDGLINTIKKEQTDFLLEDDIIFDAILKKITGDGFIENSEDKFSGVSHTTKELYETLTETIAKNGRLPKDWPGSAISFGMRFNNIKRALASKLDIQTTIKKGRIKHYKIKKKGECNFDIPF